jgi:phosphoglycerate dehydrogenase-like enzyme
MAEFRVLVAGVPYGYQGDISDGRWLTPELTDQIKAISDDIEVIHPSAYELNEGWTPAQPPHAALVETSGAEKSWEDLPAVVFGDPFLRLISPELRFVQSCSAGVEQLTPIIPEDLVLCNASGVHANAIAEAVLASILTDAKMLYQRRRDQAAGAWRQLPCRELSGAVMCILGTGHIGSAIARLAQAFGIETVGVRRRPTPSVHFDSVVGATDLASVLPRANYLVVACPLTDETRGMIGASELAQLPAGAYLVNIARGAIVDEPALIDWLRSQQPSGAYLDCHVQEPLPLDHPFWTLPTVDVSPHDSHASQLLGHHHVDLFCDNIRRCLDGRPLRNVVDAARGY